MNEPFFQGHFPGHPIMPGVLIVEAMAQAGAVHLLSEMEDRHSKLAVFTGIEAPSSAARSLPATRSASKSRCWCSVPVQGASRAGRLSKESPHAR